MEYQPEIKRNKIVIHTWMDFKNTELNERSRNTKNTTLLYDSIYIEFWKRQNNRHLDQGSKETITCKGTRRNF